VLYTIQYWESQCRVGVRLGVWGVVLVVCVCVLVSGVLLSVGVCVCVLLICLQYRVKANSAPPPPVSQLKASLLTKADAQELALVCVLYTIQYWESQYRVGVRLGVWGVVLVVCVCVSVSGVLLSVVCVCVTC